MPSKRGSGGGGNAKKQTRFTVYKPKGSGGARSTGKRRGK